MRSSVGCGRALGSLVHRCGLDDLGGALDDGACAGLCRLAIVLDERADVSGHSAGRITSAGPSTQAGHGCEERVLHRTESKTAMSHLHDKTSCRVDGAIFEAALRQL